MRRKESSIKRIDKWKSSFLLSGMSINERPFKLPDGLSEIRFSLRQNPFECRLLLKI